jgi:hypothetical protein
MALLVICAVKILRLLRLFLGLILAWFYRLLWLCASGAMTSKLWEATEKKLALLA